MADDDRSLRHYLTVTRRGWWLILLCALVVGGAAAGASFLQGERFRSTATILYTPAVVPTPLTQDGGDPSRAVDTLVGLVQTDDVLSRALPETGYETTEQLRESLDVGAGTNNDLISIQVSAPSAERAAAATNAVAEAFLDWRTEKQNELLEARIAFLNDQLATLEGSTAQADLEAAAAIRRQLTEAQAQLTTASADLTLVQPAEVPDDPYAPHPVRNGVIGFLLGLFLGVVWVLVRDRLDRRLRRVEEVEELYGAPTLGVVPYLPKAARGNRRAALGDFAAANASGEAGYVAEAYRTIRTNLGLFSLGAGGVRVIVVSSAMPDEGKSAAAANLATAFAAAGKRTLAISADVHSPTLHLYFESNGSGKGASRLRFASSSPQEPRAGLIEVLSGTVSLEAAARELSLNGAGAGGGALFLLASGKQYFDPAFLYQSPAMRTLLAQARERFDVVVIDAPPLLVSGESSVIAREADGLVLVAQVGRLTRDSARRAGKVMDAAKVRPLGVIVVGRRLEDEEIYGYGYATAS